VDLLERVAGEVRALGAETLTQAVDVAEESQVRGFVQATVARFGRLDVLVNNAGYGVRGRVEQTPAESYARLMDVNYLGTVYGCLAVLPIMKSQGRGVILNVSSIAGHRAVPGGGAYSASKAAQISLTETLRAELRGTGVSVCSVHPVGTATEFSEVAARESPGIGAAGPVGPQQTAAQVARAIVAGARRPRPEIYPHRLARVLVWLNALVPGFVDGWMYRAARRAGRI
jgi:NAD(P)-dependent dehydrogenase (short-subunit alcohol dehydrogenase family)